MNIGFLVKSVCKEPSDQNLLVLLLFIAAFQRRYIYIYITLATWLEDVVTLTV